MDVVPLKDHAQLERVIVIPGLIASLENVASEIVINPNILRLTALMIAAVSH